MRKAFFLLLILSFVFLGFKIYGEKIKFWTKQTRFDKALEFEKSLNRKYKRLSMDVSLSESVYPLINKYKIAQPIIIERKQTGFLPMYAEYFYSEVDSVLRYINYDWEKDKYGDFSKKQVIWKEEDRKLNVYSYEYDKIKAQLITQLGKPMYQDKEPMVYMKIGEREHPARKTVWENDKHYSELWMIFGLNGYRIRWSYYWKN